MMPMRRGLTLSIILLGCASRLAPAQDHRADTAFDPLSIQLDIQSRGLEYTAHEFVGVAGSGDLDLIAQFLRAGMNVDAAGTYGQTALIAASYEGMTDAAALLLEAGANPNAEDQYRATALLYAASEGYADIVALLLERGADPNSADAVFGRTPLMLVSLEGYAHIAGQLIAAGAEVDAQSVVDHSTPLMLAAANGRDEVASVLLKRRCDRRKKDQLGRTAEDLARLQGYEELARRLRARR